MMRTPQNLLLAALFVLASCGADQGDTPASVPVEPTGPDQALSSSVKTTPKGQQNTTETGSQESSSNPTATTDGSTDGADFQSTAPVPTPITGRPGSAPLDEMRSLVPADAFLWVELESFERASELLAELSHSLGGLPIPSLDSMLQDLRSFGIAADQVRQDAPVGLALSIGIDDTPMPTLVVPVENAASLAAKLQGAPGMPLPKTSGNAVAITLHASYKPNAARGALLSSGMIPSALSCRLHVESLMQSYGTHIRQGLAMAKAMPQMSAGAAELNSVARSQLDQSLRILEDTRFIGIALELREGQLELTFDLDLAAESDFITNSDGPPVDLASLKPFVDENDSIAILASLGQEHLAQFVQPMIDSFALSTDSQQGASLRQAYAKFAAVLGSEGSSFGLTWHLDQGATDVVAVLKGVDTEATYEQVKELIGQPDFSNAGFEVTPTISASDGDSRFLQLELVPNAQALLDPEAAEQLDVVESIFGTRSMLMRMVAQGDEAIFSVGQGASLAHKATRTSTKPSPELDWALDRIDSRSPALLMRMDLNRSMHGVARMQAGRSTELAPSSSFDLGLGIGEIPHLWLTSWVVFQPLHWSGGIRFDLSDMLTAGQRAASAVFPAAR